MAILHPFRAVRPRPHLASDVASVPYDVISTAEARALAAGNPQSFLHVIRPEIDLPEGVDEHADEVYQKGAENLKAFVNGVHTVQEASPGLYIYRLHMGEQIQTGIFGCVSVKEYDDEVILKHENTRPVKEKDRTRHITMQQAHAEPVMLTYPDNEAVHQVVERTLKSNTLYDFTANDGIRHQVWRVTNPQSLVEAFEHVEKLYVADGHHRCKAASLAAAAERGDGDYSNAEYEFFPAVLFPMGDMAIMPYNRIVYDIKQPAESLLQKLDEAFALKEGATPSPGNPGEISMYINNSWYGMSLPETRRETIADTLDVARLAEFVLEPFFGIADPRTDPNINFVGGIRGTGELEKLVNEGTAGLAISMFATSIQELVDVSDAGLLMPPKSTWFEPKLRSGLLVHLF